MYQIATQPILNRCVPQNITAIATYGLATSGFNPSYITEFYGDIITSRAYIFGFGFGISIILGFLWTVLLRIPGLVSLIVWTCNFAVLGFFGVTGESPYYSAACSLGWLREPFVM